MIIGTLDRQSKAGKQEWQFNLSQHAGMSEQGQCHENTTNIFPILYLSHVPFLS